MRRQRGPVPHLALSCRGRDPRRYYGGRRRHPRRSGTAAGRGGRFAREAALLLALYALWQYAGLVGWAIIVPWP